MARVTNLMVAQELLRRGVDPEKVTGEEIDWAYGDLREQTGSPLPLKSYRCRSVRTQTLSDERQSAISDLLASLVQKRTS